MPVALKVSEGAACLVASIRGHLTLDLAQELLKDILSLSASSGVAKALIDARLQSAPLSTLDGHRVGEMLAQPPFKSIRFAVVVPLGLAESHFIETVATNRGANVRYFDDYDQALRWLDVPQKTLLDNSQSPS